MPGAYARFPLLQSEQCHRAGALRRSSSSHRTRSRNMASRRRKRSPVLEEEQDVSEAEDQDPFSDEDGEYASDKNYEPENYEDESDSSENIFDVRPGFSRMQRRVYQSNSDEEDSQASDVDDADSSHLQDNSQGSHPNPSAQVSEGGGDMDISSDGENEDGYAQSTQNSDVQDGGETENAIDNESGNQNEDDGEIENADDNESGNQQQDAASNHSGVSHRSENLLQPNERLARVQRARGPGTPVNEDEWEDVVDDIPEFPFDSTSAGPTFEIDENSTPIQVFSQIVNENVIEYLVECTNAYGDSLCNKNRPHTRNSRIKSFKPTTTEEMKQFLALTFLHAHVQIPVSRKLFTHDDPLYFHPIFSHVMSGRRYGQILRCFCAAETGAVGKDKVNHFADSLIQIFRHSLNPGKDLSLDESLLLFRGRLHFRQYIKSKKARYGIKFYVLTTDDGYVLNLKMYHGSEDVTDANGEPGKKVDKLVLRLMRPYLLKGHHLYMDNFYNSVTLSQKLLDLRTHTNGTLRANRRDNPKQLIEKKLKKGEHFWLRKKKVYVSKWKDKRPVLVLTTREHPEMIEVQNRRGKRSMKPREVASYNAHMCGIDRSDQMISYYSSPRKTIRWYKKVLFHLLDIAFWNSFYLYRMYVKKSNKYEFITYREEIIRELLKLEKGIKGKDLMTRKKNDPRRHGPVQVQQAAAVPINSGHWPVRIEAPPTGKKKFAFLVCKVCAKKKVRRETSYRCQGCPETPALCPTCFREWHEDYENFKN